MPTFAISNDRGYLKVNLDLSLNWSETDFNKYPSKYAAKKHLKELDIRDCCVKVVLVLTE